VSQRPHSQVLKSRAHGRRAAADAGATAWSTAMFYGPPTDQSANVRLIGNFFKKVRLSPSTARRDPSEVAETS
jgi:aryl-alcohol dehydrogenase-like predicted oxidoreductase